MKKSILAKSISTSTFLTKSVLTMIAFALITLFGNTFTTQAQNSKLDNISENTTVISTRPISLITLQPNIKVEHAFGTNVSGGAELTMFTKINQGFRIDPFVRFYTNKKGVAPQGFYFQGKLSYGNHKEEIGEIIEGTETGGNRFNAAGGGFGIGSQWFVGANDNFSIDLYGGLRRYKALDSGELDTVVFKATRSFPTELRFSLGYAF